MPMSANALNKIYYYSKNPGFLGEVERLLRRATQLNISHATLHTV